LDFQDRSSKSEAEETTVTFKTLKSEHSFKAGIEKHALLFWNAELFLFLLSAMSFVNTIVERNVFEALRPRLARFTWL